MRDSILQVFLISYLLTCWIWPFAFALCLVNAIRDREPVLIRCSRRTEPNLIHHCPLPVSDP